MDENTFNINKQKDGSIEFHLDDGGLEVPEESPKPPIHTIDETAENDEDIKEEFIYLEDAIETYSQMINNIGSLAYSAPLLLNYRDEIQDSLDFLKSLNYDTSKFWGKVVQLDLQFKGKSAIFVKEVGYNNFKQYQIINDPPQTRWWWYLNRVVSAPEKEKVPFWKNIFK